jgi:hypothetical protein
MNRDRRKNRPVLEGLEWRLSPSGMGPSPDQQDAGHWEPKPIGNGSTRPSTPQGPTGPVRWDGNDRQDNDARDDDGQDNGSWEPKPIGHGSTRPQIPTGPINPR